MAESNRKNFCFIPVLLLAPFIQLAQTTNLGKLYVSENTALSIVETLDNREGAEFYNDGNTYVYSHFNNNGILDFFQNTGTTFFLGNSDQMISGMQVSFFNNVWFSNRSNEKPFLIAGSLEINGRAEFEEGILDVRNFGGEIAFSSTGFHTNASDHSFVDGSVHKYGTNNFVFPIGTGNIFRPAIISAPEYLESHFESKYFLEDSNDLYPHHLKAEGIAEINNKEYWILEKRSSMDEDVLISLTYHEDTTPYPFLSAGNNEELVIVRWDPESNMWINEGGVVDPSAKIVTSATRGYGIFTLARLKNDIVNPGGLIVYTAVTPNGDGINDFFLIDFPQDGSIGNLEVKIFNRWGLKVFESSNYGINDDVFKGYSQGRLNMDGREQLPTGTYFYLLEYDYDDGGIKKRHKQAGYLYLSGN